MLLKSLKSGLLQVWIHKKLVLIYYFANLVMSLLIMLPFRSILNDFAGHSLMGAKIAGQLDLDFLFEFFEYNSNALAGVGILILIVPMIYWFLSLFLSGGAFATLTSSVASVSVPFWENCARYFKRFTILVLWLIPMFIILLWLPECLVFLQRLIWGRDPYQSVTFWSTQLRMVLRFGCMLLLFLLLDYARIYLVLKADARPIEAIRNGMAWLYRHFWTAFGLTLLLFLAGLVWLGLYHVVADRLNLAAPIIIFCLFIWQQLYIIGRMLMRLSLYSSQVQLYQNLKSSQSMRIEAPAPISTILPTANPEI
ncbi:hypothetical protein L0128_13345 [candidate division KSB1 bacterium]|nr:hypothetical protein [candidate division KSB1 bacterium]